MHDGLPGLVANAHGTAPTEEELKDEVAAPGEPHLLPIGVRYQGEWREHADGLAKAVREHTQALAMYLPVGLEHVQAARSFLDHDLHPDVKRDVGYMPHLMFRSTAVAVRQFVFTKADWIRRITLPASGRIVDPEDEDRILKSTIVFTSWERDRVHDSLILELKRIGELWVPCQANWRAFVQSGLSEEQVQVVPHPYHPPTHPASQIPWPRGSESVPDGRRFYHIGKWEPRKNQHGLVGAFLRAFTPKDKVSLLIKTHGWGFWDDYPPPEESLEFWAEDEQVVENGWTRERIKQRLRILIETLSDDEIADLHRQNNIYVSPSHGEAWDMPAFDALCAGNSMVHVGYGGTEDYAHLAQDHSTVVQIPYVMGSVHEAYGWERRAKWAEYELGDLIGALREAQSPTRRIHPPKFAQFSRVHVGRKMSERVLKRTEEVGGPEAAALLGEVGSFG
jgi:glycosyltransferase involved in cell wall biosynthesis